MPVLQPEWIIVGTEVWRGYIGALCKPYTVVAQVVFKEIIIRIAGAALGYAPLFGVDKLKCTGNVFYAVYIIAGLPVNAVYAA